MNNLPTEHTCLQYFSRHYIASFHFGHYRTFLVVTVPGSYHVHSCKIIVFRNKGPLNLQKFYYMYVHEQYPVCFHQEILK